MPKIASEVHSLLKSGEAILSEKVQLSAKVPPDSPTLQPLVCWCDSQQHPGHHRLYHEDHQLLHREWL